MPRAATTTDAFNAVAEPRRRQILDALTGGELSVNDIVDAVPISQPQVSKHLRVLKEVGLVTSRSAGRKRIYRLDATALRPIHAWVAEYERHWNERLDRLDGYLGEVQRKERQ
jgi:DNA-binding transcriptional ArsR family regulator